ncbi:GDSL-type esterase/lipase family protein [Companilactobacillus ginsenosidimutans]|uniref:Lipase n=1 Tax=Companilactobacillus ginsenosidimutans TaxID=1007676 RepID=A0A0H4QYI6_9LACO|nr:GDSL-type esterase/lipase family protein [Companilactobacillus ginsenosidimutans]AKP66535.1 lipase [Companilactobacillus ginsenosidimutans]
MKKKTVWIISTIVILLLVVAGGGYYFVKTHSESVQTTQEKDTTTKKVKKISIKKKVVPKKKDISIVAIGDSLTEGIGDSKSVGGGYVTRLKKEVGSKYKVKATSANFGVSGNTSSQIIDRISFDQKIHKALPDADIITVTVGGNDFMHLLKKKGMDLTGKDIATEQQAFDQRLGVLLADIRHYNASAPIYLIGIYNPFSIYLSNVKDAQTAFVNWGKGSAQVASSVNDTYYVDINNLYQTNYADKKAQKTGINPYLSNDDHFHPNAKGYDMMTAKVFDEIQNTKKEWLYK